MCVRLGIDKRTTSAYHPQCNGQTERFNRTINDMLSQYVAANQKDWDLWLASVLFAYRSSPHSSTKISPFEMVFGRTPTQPIEFRIPVPTRSEAPKDANDYYSALQKTLASIHTDAAKQLRSAQNAQKQYYNEKANAEQFQVGELVLVYDPVTKGSPKFNKFYKGPYEVAQKPIAGGVTYVLRSLDTGTPITVHRNRLKRCNIPSEEDVQIVADFTTPAV